MMFSGSDKSMNITVDSKSGLSSKPGYLITVYSKAVNTY